MKPTQEMFKSPELAGKSDFRFIAQDQDGTIKAYNYKPLRDDVDWYPNYMIHGAMEIVIWAPTEKTFVNNWSESLIQEGKE